MNGLEIAGKLAVITGGAQGIGFAAGRALGEAGATVVLLGRTEESGQLAASNLRDVGIDAIGDGADVSDSAAMSELVSRLGKLASPDIVVASAGVMSEKMTKTLRTSPEEWDRVIGVNLTGVWNTLRAFCQGMVDRRNGRVVTVSACLGRFTGPGTAGGLAPYRISKAAVNALTRNFAAETGWGRRGVLVDAMCPNHCRTSMGGVDAPRSAQEGAETIVWLAGTDLAQRASTVGEREFPLTGLLWEDRSIVPF
jgi:NAD(P)-dependent dehydrogenase (short-subunit alcohol dehydrogenase family)